MVPPAAVAAAGLISSLCSKELSLDKGDLGWQQFISE